VLITVIGDFHDRARARVRADGVLSEVFALNTGVKQGSVLSPTIFNIFLGAIVHAARQASLGVPLEFSMSDSLLSEKTQNHPFLSYTIADILYADDMKLLARAADALNVMLQILNRITATFGQQISPEKSKVMVISSSSFDKPKIILNGCELEVVYNFKYLGSIEESNGDITEELARRRQAMGLAFHSFAHVLLDHRIRISTRFKIYNATVVPNALYGSQVWPATNKELANLEVIQTRHLRWMLKLDKYTSASVVIETAHQVDSSKLIVPLECKVIQKSSTQILWAYPAETEGSLC